jgi:hypothetical protein
MLMTITIFQTVRFGWCVEIDAPPMWKVIMRLPDLETAHTVVVQEYPGVTPTVQQPEQPMLFPPTDPPEIRPSKRPKKGVVGG